MNLLERVKKEIDRRNLSPTDLALMCGLSYWRVYHTLVGHSASGDVIARIAKVLGVKDGGAD